MRLLLCVLAVILLAIGSVGAGRGQTTAVSSQQIAERFGNSTVYVQAGWRLYDRAGKALYQKTVDVDGILALAYVNMNGVVYLWLTTTDEPHNFPVWGSGDGGGFVVNKNGMIIANKRVVAGWEVSYAVSDSEEHGRGIIYAVQPKVWNDNDREEHAEHTKWLKDHSPKVVDPNSPEVRAARAWRPGDGGPVFANSQPALVGDGAQAFEGRNSSLSVSFPGSRDSLEARLVGTSNDTDMAVINVDPTQFGASQTPAAVGVAETDRVAVGAPVVMLGYSPAFFTSQRPTFFSMREGVSPRPLPGPTATTGVISGIDHSTNDGTMATGYQISLPAGAANSSGPVFDEKGDLIGLSAYVSKADEAITYAIPLGFARRIVGN